MDPGTTAAGHTRLAERLATWCEGRHVRLCVLFGSRATGRARSGSDWDLAVWAPAVEPRERLRWHRELEEIAGGEVNLLLVGPATDPVLGFEVVRDGVVLHADRPERWPEERARLWHLYNDSLPFRRAARERLRVSSPRERMAPEVLLRKLGFLRRLLEDLSFFRDATLAEVTREHYTVERILELLATAASDVVFHLLAEKGVAPDSYRDAFRLAAEHGLLPADLAGRLQEAAGMRNVLVHLYDAIDLEILRSSVEPALRDFHQLIAVLEPASEP